MKHKFTRLFSFSFLCFAFTSCADHGVDVLGDGIVLVNLSNVSFVYVAVEREFANLIDIAGSIDVRRSRDRIANPGQIIRISLISRYEPGKDIRIFFYRLELGKNRADYASMLDISASQLAATGNRIVVRNL